METISHLAVCALLLAAKSPFGLSWRQIKRKDALHWEDGVLACVSIIVWSWPQYGI